MTIAFPKPVERSAHPVDADPVDAELTPYELSEKWYPSGGPPMPVGPVHDYVAAQLVAVMERHLQARGQEGFIINREVNLYLRRGRGVAPDVVLYVQMPLGKPSGAGSYAVPRDGAPELVIEILSSSTWQNDVPYADDEDVVASKKDFYQACEVTEYWIYDPEACRQDKAVRLEGFRLRPDGLYAEIAPDRRGHWHSAILATAWGIDRPQFLNSDRYAPLRLLDPQTGKWYPTTAEHNRQSEEKDRQIEEQDRQIEEQDRQIEEQDRQIEEKDQQIEELKALLAQYKKQ